MKTCTLWTNLRAVNTFLLQAQIDHFKALSVIVCWLQNSFFLAQKLMREFWGFKISKIKLIEPETESEISSLLDWKIRSIEPNEIQKLAVYIIFDIKNFNCGFVGYGFTRPGFAWFILNEDNSICSFALRRMDSEDFRSCTLHFEIPKKQVIEREATIWGKTVLKTFRY